PSSSPSDRAEPLTAARRAGPGPHHGVEDQGRTMSLSRRAFGVLLASALVVAAACGSDDDGDEGATGDDAVPEGTTIRVPDDYETIQEAVDAAAPGDLILIEPGVYEEAVDVTTDMLTIRGLDRNEVVDRKSTRLNSSHVKISYAVF